MIVWPKVADALLVLLPTLTGWADVTVRDGPFLQPPTDPAYCTVGAVDDEVGGGTFEQEPGTVTGLLEESGTVRCEIAVGTGADDLPVVRAQAFALIDAVDFAVRADQTLSGALGPDGVVTVGGDVLPVQNTSGTAVRLVLAVSYFTRT